jgi:leader peptidase (prepilin peptidase)/N-methyltransferase
VVDVMETTLVVIGCAVMGVIIGSFLTVVVDRVPRGASIVTPGSACGSCGLQLGVLDLVPVLSWLALRGKCRRCKAPIGIEPIIVELATASLFVLFGVHFGAAAVLPAFCIFGAALIALTWIDLRDTRLPREITYTAFVLGAAALTVAALVDDEPRRIWTMLFGAGLALAIMGAIYLGSRGGLGEGDVRLAPLLGLYLGWLNPGIVPVGLFYGFVLGAVVGVAMMAAGKAGKRTALPFGPFLAAGTVAAVFAGQWFVDMLWHR